jgi:HD-like signal output (HDOD) protein
MKNWFARWFGRASQGAGAPVTPVTPVTPLAAADAGAPAETAGAANGEVDLAFYHWLAGSAGGDAPQATERLILDELARLAQEPAKAAALVPRVPAVIPELLRSLRDEGVSNADLSRLVAQDVVLVAEVVREANSPYYRPPAPIRTIEGALMLLGQNGLRMLLARVAFRPVISMQAGRFARLAAPRIWLQSEKCALACASLAPQAGAHPFEAYLAGLIQNVGLVVALRLIDQVAGAGLLPGSDAFRSALLAHARRLAHAIALEWAFPPAVAGAIAGAAMPDAGPLARVLGTADLLAKLRLLVDAGELAPDDPLLVSQVRPDLQACFDALRSQEAS